MLLWVLCALVTVAAVLGLLRPLFRAPAAVAPSDAPEVAIYKQQLSEIEADLARGLIAPGEAKSAKIEVSRRLLAAVPDHAETTAGSATTGAAAMRTALAAAVPLLAIGLYLGLGSPGMRDQPHAARVSAMQTGQPTIPELVAMVEARLRAHPEDGPGWEVIAPVYMRQQRFADAAIAYERALRLLGEDPRRLAGHAEARIFADGGVVGEAARHSLERLLALNPQSTEARFWLATAKEQDGKLDAAAADFRAMLAEAPKDVPWRGMVEERLAEVVAKIKGEAPRGPSAADVAAAQAMPKDAQAKMIEDMVAGLADRLSKNGRDPAGWERLIRAYIVLGRKEDALKALGAARKALAEDAAALAKVNQAASNLGLGS